MSDKQWFFSIVTTLVVLGVSLAGGCPKYLVWQRALAGESELRRAEWDRKIRVLEAEAEKDAATMLADAEVERAKGVAEANRIIGDSLQDNEVYLRYLWVQGLRDGSSEVIYVPTEANLPILEAGRFSRPAPE